MTSVVRTYVWAVVVAASAAVAVLFGVAPAFSWGYASACLVLAFLGFLALSVADTLPQGQAGGSTAFIPFVAAALVSPNWIAVVAVASSMVLAAVVARKSLLKAVFNIAQASLALSLGTLCYVLLGGGSLLRQGRISLLASSALNGLPFCVLLAVFFAVNTLAVSGAIALSEHKNIVRVWQQNTLGTLLYDVLSGPVVYFLGWIYVHFGPIGAAGIALPMLGVRQLYRTNRQLERVNRELLELMVKAIEARDPYTSGHSRRVQHYSRIIAQAIGVSGKQVERVGFAALLHDVGKIHEVYAPILRKPDKLTSDERAIMQTHAVKSAELISTVSNLKDLVLPVRHHHENWDGTGYPDGLAGESIPLASRIIMFADTIDAMTTDRPYRKALTEAQVRAELLRFRGKQFDPHICDRLLESPLFSSLFANPLADSTASRQRRISPPRSARAAVG